MNWKAAFSTGLVHSLGVGLALIPLTYRPLEQLGTGFGAPSVGYQHRLDIFSVPAPPLVLAAVAAEKYDFEDDPMTCPRAQAIDDQAAPDFPLFGAERPLQHVPPARWNPVFCARIGEDGHVLEVRPTELRSGNAAADRAIARELARLRFRPARRGGQPVEAWHRVDINLPGASPPPLTDRPTPCLTPGRAAGPCEYEPDFLFPPSPVTPDLPDVPDPRSPHP